MEPNRETRDSTFALWLPEGGSICNSMSPTAGNFLSMNLMVAMPVNTPPSAKPMVLAGNGNVGYITYVGDPVSLYCGDVAV